MNDGKLPFSGPYRATKLWNDVIQTFRQEMPVSRHRRYMKTYDKCFTAGEAVDWLHEYLKSNCNFGPDVTRAQTLQLLQKFHRARVIEDVRGGKQNRPDVTDNGRLFRCRIPSPTKPFNTLSRTPFSNRTDLINKDQVANTGPPVKLNLDKHLECQIPCSQPIPECHLVSKQPSAADIENIWKHTALDKLQQVLHTRDLSDVLDSSFVVGRNIMHNCLYINKSGIVTNIQPKDQLPHWALSAMKCLAHWPHKVDDNLPSYPGFERDVFRVVKDYFCGLPEPLFTYEMYEVVINVFVAAEGKSYQRESQAQLYEDSPEALTSFESVENLMLDLTSTVPSGKSYRSTPDARLNRMNSASTIDLSPIHPVYDSISKDRTLRRCASSGNVKYAKYETAFGPENRTITRVYYKNGVATDYSYHDEEDSLYKTPVETHFEYSSDISDKLQEPIIDSYDTNDAEMNFARVKPMRRKKTDEDPSKEDVQHRKSYGYSVAAVIKPCKQDARSQRRSVGSQLPDDKVSRIEGYTKNKVRARHHSSKVEKPPPSYNSLFPDNYQPVINGKQKPRTIPRSKSSHSLIHNVNDGCTLPGYHVTERLDSASNMIHKPIGQCSQGKSTEPLPGRSLSMTDLLHGQTVGNGGLKRSSHAEDLSEDDILERTRDALQLVCLLLPPANRRKLHLLLKLMSKMADNRELHLDDKQTTRTLLLETFSQCILSCQDELEMEDLLVMRIVSFLMDNHTHVMAVPADLKTTAEDKLTKSKSQIVYSLDDPSSIHYCKQVTKEQYDEQRLSFSQKALADLLEEIINDKTMSYKDKKKRLKTFQKTYPDIYAHRFPPHDGDKNDVLQKPKIKQPLLSKPLMKLKAIRI
ncbi:hypothetical protein FSP39_005143 [Pinctada imbricata]|uniref:DEP domain-containing protein n=1 Tax=Pinctada imbricata TaxID=66713 RepID=A0AA89BW32_PINIB|nr:hypothetical protein FSP39_005143 [Pinctada imbricata]